MSEQKSSVQTEQPAAPSVDPALIIAILLFVGLYLWGFVLGVIELAERKSSVPTPSERRSPE